MSDTEPDRQPSEAELRAAYEQQLKSLRVEDLVVETVISLLNLGGRKAGLSPGTEDEVDMGQVRVAVEGVRALLPLCEDRLGPDAGPIRQALSQLQMAYAQRVGTGGGSGGEDPPPSEEPPEPEPGQPGPAQSSGRLWIPGQ
jgi:hypothetical protein